MITVELDNFSLKQICQSGQCFRMRETEENTYELIAGDQYLKLTQEGTIVTFHCSDVEFLCYWVPYFDIDADYAGYIEKINPRDHYLSAAAECGSGIRILRQDLWEMIITFLISQQNNISRIRGCIDRLCKRYGEQKYSEEGVEYWTFPTAEQLGTIQVDYNLPERFDLTYKGADDRLHRPIMIHRAPFGSMERFVAVLLEHTGGKFPLWLSPQQVVVLPISEKFNDYAQKVSEFLNRSDVRTEVDDRNEKIGRKIRDNELKRIPYLLIVGEKEEAEGLVSVRAQGEGDKGQMTLEAFRDYMTDLVSHEIDANKMEQKN